MLATLIQKYDKKIISFLIQFKNLRQTDFLQAVRCHIYDHINKMYQFISPFLDKKCLFLRNMEPLRCPNI